MAFQQAQRIVFNGKAAHHWTVFCFLKRGEILVHCSDCDDEVSMPLSRLARLEKIIAKAEDLQVVVWVIVNE
jgi:hypothetical protein